MTSAKTGDTKVIHTVFYTYNVQNAAARNTPLSIPYQLTVNPANMVSESRSRCLTSKKGRDEVMYSQQGGDSRTSRGNSEHDDAEPPSRSRGNDPKHPSYKATSLTDSKGTPAAAHTRNQIGDTPATAEMSSSDSSTSTSTSSTEGRDFSSNINLSRKLEASKNSNDMGRYDYQMPIQSNHQDSGLKKTNGLDSSSRSIGSNSMDVSGRSSSSNVSANAFGSMLDLSTRTHYAPRRKEVSRGVGRSKSAETGFLDLSTDVRQLAVSMGLPSDFFVNYPEALAPALGSKRASSFAQRATFTPSAEIIDIFEQGLPSPSPKAEAKRPSVVEISLGENSGKNKQAQQKKTIPIRRLSMESSSVSTSDSYTTDGSPDGTSEEDSSVAPNDLPFSELPPVPPTERTTAASHPEMEGEKRLDREKSISRLERMKAKAIESAQKDLGADASGLANVMGMNQTTMEGKPVQSNPLSDKGVLSVESFSDEEAQVKFLADALGLPVSFFGGTSAKTPIEKRKSGLLQEVAKKITLGESQSDSEDDDEEKEKSEESIQESAIFAPQAHSLAEALGITVDPSSTAPPVRQRPLLPFKVKNSGSFTYENAKGREANPEISTTPRPNSLAAALGIAIDPSATAPAVRHRPSRSIQDEADSEDGGRSSSGSDSSDDSSMSSADQRHVETEPPTRGQGVYGRETPQNLQLQYLNDHGGARFLPQAGSLAEALGMTIDPSSRAPPIRFPEKQQQPEGGSHENSFKSSSSDGSIDQLFLRHAGNLEDALGMSASEETFSSSVDELAGFVEQSGSLAEALGISIKYSDITHPTSTVGAENSCATHGHNQEPGRGSARENNSASGESEYEIPVRFSAQPGSLAAALGLSADPSSRAPPVRQMAIKRNPELPRNNQSLAATESRYESKQANSHGQHRPRASSPAAALGLSFDESSTLTTTRPPLDAGNSPGKKIGDKNRYETSAPVAGSLAAVLGIGVSPSGATRPPVVSSRQQRLNSCYESSDSEIESSSDESEGLEFARFAPQPGSLAAALGLSVDPSSKAPPVRRVPQNNATRKRGLFRGVDNHVTTDGQSSERQRAGTLAAALGMLAMDTNQSYRMERDRNDQTIENQREAVARYRHINENSPLPGSIAAALGIQTFAQQRDDGIEKSDSSDESGDEASTNDDSEVSRDDETSSGDDSVVSRDANIVPQSRSLAAALGMAKNTSTEGPPTRSPHSEVAAQSSRQMKQSLFYASSEWLGQRPGFYFGTGNQGTGYYKDGVNTADYPPPVLTQKSSTAAPRKGTVAAALGIQIDSSPNSAVDPKGAKKNLFSTVMNNALMAAKSGGNSSQMNGGLPKPGSLATALGMKTYSAESARYPKPEATSRSPLQGSLAAALGIRIEENTSSPSEAENALENSLKPGDLDSPAMSIAASSETTATKDPVNVPVPMTSSTKAQRGSSESKFEIGPKPGSLAAALGMIVEDEDYIPPTEVGSSTLEKPGSLVSHSQLTNAISGSLAAALSTVSPPASREQVVPASKYRTGDGKKSVERTTPKTPPGKSLFGVVLGKVVSHATGQGEGEECPQPRQGSLAEALGMHIKEEPSFHTLCKADPILSVKSQHGTLAAALGATIVSSSSQMNPSQIRIDSLAAAWKVPVEKTNTPADEDLHTPHTHANRGNRSFFDAVISSAAGTSVQCMAKREKQKRTAGKYIVKEVPSESGASADHGKDIAKKSRPGRKGELMNERLPVSQIEASATPASILEGAKGSRTESGDLKDSTSDYSAVNAKERSLQIMSGLGISTGSGNNPLHVNTLSVDEPRSRTTKQRDVNGKAIARNNSQPAAKEQTEAMPKELKEGELATSAAALERTQKKNRRRKSLFEPVTVSSDEGISKAAYQEETAGIATNEDKKVSKRKNLFSPVDSQETKFTPAEFPQIERLGVQDTQFGLEPLTRLQSYKPHSAINDGNQIEKEKAMSRVDKVKSNVTRSENRELDVNEADVAPVLGKPPSDANGSNVFRQGDEAAQLQSRTVRPVSPSQEDSTITSKKPKSLLEYAVRDASAKVNKRMETLGEVDEVPEIDDISDVAEPKAQSLASALGMKVDVSVDAPAVRKKTFKPFPVTDEAKRVDKERAMTRLERIKAKALKSVKKELGVDVDSLATVMGVPSNPKAQPSGGNGGTVEAIRDEAEQVVMLAESLGLPASFFDVTGQTQQQGNMGPGPQKTNLPYKGTENSKQLGKSSKPQTSKSMEAFAPISPSPRKPSEQAAALVTPMDNGKLAKPDVIVSEFPSATSPSFLDAAEKITKEISNIDDRIELVIQAVTRAENNFGRDTTLSEVRSQVVELVKQITSARDDVAGVKMTLSSMEAKIQELNSSSARHAADSMMELNDAERRIGNTVTEFQANVFKKANSFSDKLSKLHDRLLEQEGRVLATNHAVDERERALANKFQVQESVSSRWAETEERFTKACKEIQDFRSLLAAEYEEIKIIKASLEEERYIHLTRRMEVFDESQSCSDSGSKDDVGKNNDEMAALTSDAILKIQRKLQLEGQRRKTLTEKLKAKRKNQRKAVIDSDRLQHKIVVKLDEKAAERVTRPIAEALAAEASQRFADVATKLYIEAGPRASELVSEGTTNETLLSPELESRASPPPDESLDFPELATASELEQELPTLLSHEKLGCDPVIDREATVSDPGHTFKLIDAASASEVDSSHILEDDVSDHDHTFKQIDAAISSEVKLTNFCDDVASDPGSSAATIPLGELAGGDANSEDCLYEIKDLSLAESLRAATSQDPPPATSTSSRITAPHGSELDAKAGVEIPVLVSAKDNSELASAVHYVNDLVKNLDEQGKSQAHSSTVAVSASEFTGNYDGDDNGSDGAKESTDRTDFPATITETLLQDVGRNADADNGMPAPIDATTLSGTEGGTERDIVRNVLAPAVESIDLSKRADDLVSEASAHVETSSPEHTKQVLSVAAREATENDERGESPIQRSSVTIQADELADSNGDEELRIPVQAESAVEINKTVNDLVPEVDADLAMPAPENATRELSAPDEATEVDGRGEPATIWDIVTIGGDGLSGNDGVDGVDHVDVDVDNEKNIIENVQAMAIEVSKGFEGNDSIEQNKPLDDEGVHRDNHADDNGDVIDADLDKEVVGEGIVPATAVVDPAAGSHGSDDLIEQSTPLDIASTQDGSVDNDRDDSGDDDGDKKASGVGNVRAKSLEAPAGSKGLDDAIQQNVPIGDGLTREADVEDFVFTSGQFVVEETACAHVAKQDGAEVLESEYLDDKDAAPFPEDELVEQAETVLVQEDANSSIASSGDEGGELVESRGCMSAHEDATSSNTSSEVEMDTIDVSLENEEWPGKALEIKHHDGRTDEGKHVDQDSQQAKPVKTEAEFKEDEVEEMECSATNTFDDSGINEESPSNRVEITGISSIVDKSRMAGDEGASTDTPVTSNKALMSDEVDAEASTRAIVIPPPPMHAPEGDDKDDDTSWMLGTFGFILMCSFASYIAYTSARSTEAAAPAMPMGAEESIPATARIITPVADSPTSSTPPSSALGEKRLRSALKRHASLKKKMSLSHELTTTGSEFKNYDVPLMAMSFVNIRDNGRVEMVGIDGNVSSDESTDSGTTLESTSSSDGEDFVPFPSPSSDLFAPSLSVYHRSMQPSQSRAARKAARKRRRKQFFENLKVLLQKELESEQYM